MTEKKPATPYKAAKLKRKEAVKARKTAKMSARTDKIQKQTQIRQKAKDIGYNGPIIMPNEKHGTSARTDEVEVYFLVPIGSGRSKPAPKKRGTARGGKAKSRR